MSKRTLTHLIEKEEAKKRRLDGNVESEENSVIANIQPPDELSSLENLTRCGTVIEKIMEYLPNKDVLSLTLTSKTLNGFISENPKILQKFAMKIPQIGEHNKYRYAFEQIRRYPKWELNHGIHLKNIRFTAEFLQRYGAHVKNLKIQIKELAKEASFKVNYHITKTSLMKVLSCCQNLQQLYIDVRWSKKRIVNCNKAADLPHLKNLILRSNFSALLPMFKDCKLRTVKFLSGFHGNFHYRQDNLGPDPIQIVKDFFKGQNELENLEFMYFPDQLWNDDQMSTVGFKLKSFSCAVGDSQMYDDENYAKFFNLHKLSLVDLTVPNVNVLKFFEGFNSIKFLSVNLYDGNLNTVWPSVEKLIIIDVRSHFEKLNNLESYFPNVKEIETRGMTIHRDFLSELPKIENAKLFCGEVATNMSISNLKVLHLSNVTINANVNFTWNGNQLKKLVVKWCTVNGVTSFIEQLLMREDTNLDRLELFGEFYTKARNSALHQVITQNRHKIKILTIKET